MKASIVFNVASNAQADDTENGERETQNNDFTNEYGQAFLGENIQSTVQVIERNIGDMAGKKLDSGVVAAVKYRAYDVNLTAMDSVDIPKVELAVLSFTGSLEHVSSNLVQNSDRTDFLAETEHTPLKTASTHRDLHRNRNRKNETQNETTEDDDLPTLRFNFDRHTHYKNTPVFFSFHYLIRFFFVKFLIVSRADCGLFIWRCLKFWSIAKY